MYKIIVTVLAVLSSPAFANDPLNRYQQGTYGPNTASDQYGRAYTVEPNTQLRQNAYGLGVHSDQTGRVVEPKPMNENQHGWSK